MNNSHNYLKRIVLDIREDVIDMVRLAKSGHLGASLSATDILTVLYFYDKEFGKPETFRDKGYLRYDPENPEWEERTRFVLSKGHAAPAYYAVLSKAGYFSRDELKKFRTSQSPLEGHPPFYKKWGIEGPTGLLGNGLALAVGRALDGHDVIVLLGDGEFMEETIKGPLEIANQYKLGNLLILVDNNNYSLDREIPETLRIHDVCDAFGCHVIGKEWSAYDREQPAEVDGHDSASLSRAFDKAIDEKNHPTVIIANTEKGRGIPAVERDESKRIIYHGTQLSDDDYIETKKHFARERERLGGDEYDPLCEI